MQTCEHVDISSSSNMGRQINPNNLSHVFTSTSSQLFGCMLSVTRVTKMTLAPTRTGHKNPANESKPPLAGKWPSNHRFNCVETIHCPPACDLCASIMWTDYSHTVPFHYIIVFPRDFFGCLFYAYDCLWLSSPFLLLRPLKTTCNKQKTQQWFLTMMWFSSSRTQPCKFLNFIDLLFICRPFPIVFPSNIRILRDFRDLPMIIS